jgi:hypothetical protein
LSNDGGDLATLSFTNAPASASIAKHNQSQKITCSFQNIDN